MTDRLRERLLVLVALAGLALGTAAWATGREAQAAMLWTAGTLPVLAVLAWSIARDLLAGRMGVDAVALVSMSAALLFGEPLAAGVVALMFSGGTLLEGYAIGRAERSLTALVDRAPRTANRIRDDVIESIPVAEVEVGDRLLVRPGEIVPVDGEVAEGAGSFDESAVTGEPIPVARAAGERVLSGTVNADGSVVITASAGAGESTYAGIVRMVTAAQTAKAPFIRLADRFALAFLPLALVIAGAAWWASGETSRLVAVLVSATPCPLILAAPVAFIAGVARAARRGILVKGGGPLEALARVRTVLFDKTGTLTIGGARLVAIETAPGIAESDVLTLAASLEQASGHVVARAVVEAARGRGVTLAMPDAVHEDHGAGLSGKVGGRLVKVGTHELVLGTRRPGWADSALAHASRLGALSVFVSVDGEPIGAMILADTPRPETAAAVAALKQVGVTRTLMVTGDHADGAQAIAAGLGLDAVLADQTPADKLAAVAAEKARAPVLMVGDGINDAPALAAADVGMAMGARGASASSQAADVVLLVDRVDRVPEAIAIARRARGIALQSIAVGMGLSLAAMIAAAFGYIGPVAGALIQEGIDVAVILNALRALSGGLTAAPPVMSTSGRAVDERA